MREVFNSHARLSWVLAGLAGLVGAAAFTKTAGYFVTFMTGNTERGAVGFFRGENAMAGAAILLVLTFVVGVVVASLCRRHLWSDHPHGATVLTTAALAIASAVDVLMSGWSAPQVQFVPILFISFAMGALNTSFVKNGEVSIPLSYVTGTLVKMGQGIERHISGGSAKDWLEYFLLYAAFTAGAVIGGVMSLFITGPQVLVAATVVCAITTLYTYRRTVEDSTILG
ncbi:YoaK family protein [Rhodococcoides yunnanense]|uniref:YoaK family protein n=1 Tax=Rhodococcoides yunnanense TaxID=278209 RepID=UPI000933051C|nr:YoaK family protein [Rhodococcus yunnanensis]